jgi:acyl carrier protein
MSIRESLQQIVSAQLGAGYPPASFTPERPMLGAIAELDSMAVVGILAAIEDQLGITVEDDEISAEAFETFGALERFVTQRP